MNNVGTRPFFGMRSPGPLYTSPRSVEETLLFIVGALLGAGVALVAVRRSRGGSTPVAPSREPVAEAPTPELGDSVIQLLSEGVVLFNDLLRPVISNHAARRLLGIDVAQRPLPPDEVMSIARRSLTSGRRVEETVDLWNPERVSVQVRAEPLESDRGVLVSLRDISAEQRALRIRRQFVAHASHELKSPVASIQALAEAISQAAADDARTVEEFAEKMLKETARMGKLIADLLDLSRIEDPSGFRRQAVNVAEVARKITEEAVARASAKGLRLTTVISEPVWTQGDEHQLSLLIRNLLDNAIRYTPDGGDVTVEVERDADQAIVRVTDDGIGIPLNAQGRVFERFYRVDEARSRDQGGTGLGLAIVKHVADLYGGRVELRSEFGEGSTFTVYLPRSESALSTMSRA